MSSVQRDDNTGRSSKPRQRERTPMPDPPARESVVLAIEAAIRAANAYAQEYADHEPCPRCGPSTHPATIELTAAFCQSLEAIAEAARREASSEAPEPAQFTDWHSNAPSSPEPAEGRRMQGTCVMSDCYHNGEHAEDKDRDDWMLPCGHHHPFCTPLPPEPPRIAEGGVHHR